MKRERPEGSLSANRGDSPAGAASIRIVAILRALGNDSRLDFYRFIAGQPDPICVCDIVDRFA